MGYCDIVAVQQLLRRREGGCYEKPGNGFWLVERAFGKKRSADLVKLAMAYKGLVLLPLETNINVGRVSLAF